MTELSELWLPIHLSRGARIRGELVSFIWLPPRSADPLSDQVAVREALHPRHSAGDYGSDRPRVDADLDLPRFL